MRITFAFLGCLSLAASALLFLSARSAVHEILAAIMLLIFVLCAATTAILGAMARLKPGAITTAQTMIGSGPPAEPAPDAAKPAGNWVKLDR